MEPLRKYSEIHIDKIFEALSGSFDNALFFNCKFDSTKDLVLKDCVLTNSDFDVQSVRQALGLTVTLDCFSFKGVKLSPLMFDMMLALLIMGKGNDEKREQLKEVMGSGRWEAVTRLLRAEE